MNFQDIDWNKWWQEGRRHKSWPSKKDRDWDQRASAFARRDHTDFVGRLLAIMEPEPTWTVLDIGSGPGTVALPLARQVKEVTALDFSEKMLAALQQSARRQGLTNVTTRQLAWEDDWQQAGLPGHDVALACRSLNVDDLRAALEKLHRWAGRKVFIVDRVGAGPFDPDLFAAVGREFVPGPDYIYTYNLLYQMGLYARVEFITLPCKKDFPSREEAEASCRWMLGTLTAREEERMQRFLAERLTPATDGQWLLRRRVPPRWAVLWWDKPEGECKPVS